MAALRTRRCGADSTIRVSTAAVVLAVAGIAAYISYWHAYAVVREWGESGVTAVLEPATIDGLVYASSMVILYAARHRLSVPRLARWMLALGVAASLAVNVAQGWSHGLVGAVVAAWPAVALVGSYELFAWMIRTAAGGGPGRAPAADQGLPNAQQPVTSVQPPALLPRQAGPVAVPGCDASEVSEGADGLLPVARAVSRERGSSLQGQGQVEGAEHTGEPVLNAPGRRDPASRGGRPGPVSSGAPRGDIDAAAVATYRASVREGAPLSERKLAAAFGSTSRRWARNRIAEAWKSPAPG